MKKLGRKVGLIALGALMSGTALLVTPRAAEAQDSPWWIYLDGGYSFLTGNASDAYDGGFTGGLAFGKIIQERFLAGLFGEVGFHSSKEFNVIGISEFGKATVWRYGLWGGVNALEPANPWAVIFGAGLGLGTISVGEAKDAQGASIPGSGFSETDFLLQGNIAVSRQMAEKVSLGLNSTFYIIFTEGDSWTAIPLEAFVAITP